MKKEDIKVGYVLEVEDSRGKLDLCMVLPNCYDIIGISGKEVWFPLSYFDKNLKHSNKKVTKIYGRTNNKESHKLEVGDRKLLWERCEGVDWGKVEVDTPILVSFNNNVFVKRHFAKYEDGIVHAWINGLTSFTAEGRTTSWTNVKLAHEHGGE